MSRTNLKIMRFAKTFISLTLTLVLTISISFSTASAYTSQSRGEITYNKGVFDKYPDVCERIREGLENLEDEIYIGDLMITNEEIQPIVKTVFLKYPELFYVDFSNYSYGSDGTYAIAILPYYTADSSNIDEKKAAFNTKVDAIMSKIDSSMTDLEKALVIHDEIVMNCEYDTSDTRKYSLSAYDTLVNGKAVCQGYTAAYSYLLSLAGVDNEIVESTQMCHSWNKIKIDGEYYNVDITWDDPVPNRSCYVSHKYFLLSDSNITNGTNGETQHYGFDSAYYKATSTKFDSYLIHDVDTKYCHTNNGFYVIDDNLAGSYAKSLLKYDINTNKAEIVKKFSYKWSAGTNSNWIGSFMSLDEHNGTLYYNTPTAVISYDTSTNAETVIKTASNSDNYYGLVIKDDELYANVNTDPNLEGTLVFVKAFQKASVSNNGNTENSNVITQKIVKGDVDLSGTLDVSDATAIQKYLAGLSAFTSTQSQIADYDGDGSITITDATDIQKVLAGL
jgi:hypothetical protein